MIEAIEREAASSAKLEQFSAILSRIAHTLDAGQLADRVSESLKKKLAPRQREALMDVLIAVVPRLDPVAANNIAAKISAAKEEDWIIAPVSLTE